MDQTLRYAAVVAGAGLAGCLLLFALPARQGGDAAPAEAVVVTLPPSRGEAHRPPVPVPAPRPAVNPATAQKEPVSIGRQLQMELRRVGCYGGAIDGHWNAATRQAMKTFTDRVNAKLPVERPDPILLALVQSQREPACVPACAEGPQAAADGGRCLPQPAGTQEAAASAETARPAPAEFRPSAPAAGAGAVAAAAAVSAAVPTPQTRAPAGLKLDAAAAVPPPAPPAATSAPPPVAEPGRAPKSEDASARPATNERRTRPVRRKYPSIQTVFRKLQRAAIGALPLP